MPKTYTVRSRLQIFDMYAPWMYILIPNTKVPNVRPGGWGSIPVVVTVGNTTWITSLFPMRGGQYFLPIKKLVAKKENLKLGAIVSATYAQK